MSNDDFSKNIEKAIEEAIESGLKEVLKCSCGHKFNMPLNRVKNNSILVCPVCSTETEFRIRAE